MSRECNGPGRDVPAAYGLCPDEPGRLRRRGYPTLPAHGLRRLRRCAVRAAEDHLKFLSPRSVRALSLGVAVGMLSGLFGIGGGALAVPGLLWLGLAQHAAHATSLAAIILTAAAALIPFALDGAVEPLASVVLVAGALTGTYGSTALMHRVPEARLRQVFVVFLVALAVRMLIGVDTEPGVAVAFNTVGLVALAAVGIATGVLSGVLGVGGGLVLVPALVLLFGFPQHAAEGTSLAVIVPTALLGAVRHTRRGYTQWRTGLTVGMGGIAGGIGGAALALVLDGLLLQRLFAAFLAAMAVRLWLHGRHTPGYDPP